MLNLLITNLTASAALSTGIITSFAHVVSGPDHLAAVTSLSVATKKKAWKIGFSWGLGHLGGILIVGVLFLKFKEAIPVELISTYSEQLVAWILIAIGLKGFYSLKRKKEAPKNSQHSSLNETRQRLLSSLGIGLVHGLAGVSHFLMMLPILTFDSPWSSSMYLTGFALGTVSAMTLYAALIGLTSLFSQSNQQWTLSIRSIAAGFALVIGVYWLFLSV